VSKAVSLARVGIVYVVALAAATAWLALGPDTGHLWLDALIADLIATVVVFVASRIHHNSSCYDPYWSVLPPYLVGFWLLQDRPGVDHARATLLTIVVAVWAVRLTANWVQDWPGMHHEDWRYPMLRDKAGPAGAVVDLVGIHVIPTLIVFLGLLPAYAVLGRPGRDLNVLDVVATVVGLAAPVLQLVADAQMRSFIQRRQPGQAMDQGLWAWSRHPNYFGEISFWWSLALFGIAASPADWWWLPVGGVAMVAMFVGASIPMMEQRSLERRPAYQQVVERVPVLVPRPPSWARRSG
jgi:steroid 5-alpha reductase family enzyme